MADLESALHYILRIEVGKFSVLEGQRLVALKKFMAVLAKVSGALGPLIPKLHMGPVCIPAGRCCALLEESARPLPLELVVGFGSLDPPAVAVHRGLLPCGPSHAPPSPLGQPPSPVQGGRWDMAPDARGVFPPAHVYLPESSASGRAWSVASHSPS